MNGECAIEPRVLARNVHASGSMSLAAPAAQRLGGGNCQHPGAGADVEPGRLLQFDQPSSASRQPRVVRDGRCRRQRRLDLDAIRFGATTERSCSPCTVKRPAVTGLRAGKARRNQSLAATVSNTSSSHPAASADQGRTRSSGGSSNGLHVIARPSPRNPQPCCGVLKLSTKVGSRLASSVANQADQGGIGRIVHGGSH